MDSGKRSAKAAEAGDALWENLNNDRQKLETDFADFDNAANFSPEQVAFSPSRAQVDIGQLPAYSDVVYPGVTRNTAARSCNIKTKWVVVTTIVVSVCVMLLVLLSVYVSHVASSHGASADDHGTCSHAPCRHGATCLDDDDIFHCSCAPGYSGHLCEIDLDECSSEPCNNGGTCHDGSNGYTCECQIGYAGNNCEIEVNECQSSPCLHWSTCHDDIGGYHCNCNRGYRGENCQTVMTVDDVCPRGFVLFNEQSRCYAVIANASLLKSEAEAACDGMDAELVSLETGEEVDFIGNYLATGHQYITSAERGSFKYVWASHVYLNPQDSHWGEGEPNLSARPRHDCVSVFKSATDTYLVSAECDYRSPYICEAPTYHCNADDPCMNGASCLHVGNDGARCECLPGYRGPFCGTDIDDCAGQPCDPEALCVDLVNSYECRVYCPTGFSLAVHSMRCYYMERSPGLYLTWADAHEICEFKSAALVSLESDSEGVELTSLFLNKTVNHLTSARRERDGLFYWSTGAVVTSSHLSWAPGEPRAHYDCTSFKQYGNVPLLYSVDCDIARPFVCEKGTSLVGK